MGVVLSRHGNTTVELRPKRMFLYLLQRDKNLVLEANCCLKVQYLYSVFKCFSYLLGFFFFDGANPLRASSFSQSVAFLTKFLSFFIPHFIAGPLF